MTARLALGCLLPALLAAALAGPARATTGLDPVQAAQNEALNEEIVQFQLMVEEALVWRVQSAELHRRLDAKNRRGYLTSADLQTMYAGAEAYLELRERLFGVVRRHDQVYGEVGGALAAIDYRSTGGRLFMKRLKLALAAGLILYDNYTVGIHPYTVDGKFRRLLTTDRPELQGRLGAIQRSYLDPLNRRKMAFGIAAYLGESRDPSYAPLDWETDYLDALVRQSPGLVYLRRSGFDVAGGTLLGLTRAIGDELGEVSRFSTFTTSRLFGNSIGLIETRRGHLTGLTPEERRELADRLEPLDVLLEKTPFRLTDKFIPGHWGHVAIWVGNERQLRALGVWNDPAVAPYHAAIRQGRQVVEALRPGVSINRLDEFLNIDDLAVLRRGDLAPAQRREFIRNAFRQIGKAYDFLFDVETDRRIVCSEIAYVVFPDVAWPTARALGRYTISPDHVAERGTRSNPFTPVVLFHRGVRLDERLEETFAALLKQDYGAIDALHPGFTRRVPYFASPVHSPESGWTQ